MLFGLAGGIALGLFLGRAAKYEIAFLQSPSSASPDAAAWIRLKPAASRSRPEPAPSPPAIDYVAGVSRFDEVLAFTAGVGETPLIARANPQVRRK
jgi:hypothetical protein